MTQHLKKLEQAIEALWRQGLQLDAEALHYIDSTFSRPSLEELQGLLSAESNCEKDSLLELIFFPGRAIQMQLEDLLESHEFHPEDEETLSRTLAAKKLQTVLFLPDGRGRLVLSVPDWAAARFISRLNITRTLTPTLVAAIEHHVPGPHQALCRVMLRNTRSRLTAPTISFLGIFFERMTVDFRIVLEAYAFLLSFFEERPDDTDFYRALLQKKRFYFQNLQRALRFEVQLKNSNMETLLLQGVRMPYFDVTEARRCMGLIDTICHAVFGKSEFWGIGDSVDLGQVDRQNDLDTLFKLLS